MADEMTAPEPVGKEATDQAQKPTRPARRRTMPASPNRGMNDSEATKGAGAAGVGGGTLIAVLASALPDGLWKTVLIWLAPTATITVSALWIYARRKVVAYFDDRDAEREFAAARKAISQALGNQNLTVQQRAEFESKQVELDQMIVERRMSMATIHGKR